MPKYVCMGALIQCSCGLTPSSLIVKDLTRPTIQGKPKANVMDFAPIENIPSFGMCKSMANPTVSAATAAAGGVLTQMPCVPVITAPWLPGGQQTICNIPALLENGKCFCSWGGTISFKNPGHTKMTDGK